MILIVGLGNPGDKYCCTRHNIGFVIVDKLVEILPKSSYYLRFNCELFKLDIEGKNVLLVKPLTFMNNSGAAVYKIKDFYSEDIERILVIHDDLDIEFGNIRFKSGGGTGGHNGLESLVKSLQGAEFDRLRVGIGRPPANRDPAKYVLSCFKKTELKEIENIILESSDATVDYIKHDIDFVMNKYNSRQ